MPLRGETIGTAYVRILADGHDLPDSVKEEMDRATPVMEAAGTKHSQSYEAAFAKEFKKVNSRDIDKILRDSIAKSDAIEKFFNNDPRWQRIAKRLEKDFGAVGLQMAHNLAQGVRESQDLETIGVRLKNINREILIANRQIISGMKQEADEFTRATHAAIDTERHMRSLGDQFRKIKSAEEETAKTEPRLFSKSLLGRTEKLGHNLDILGNKVGRAFGAGARNNALNLFGRGVQSVVEGVARLFIGIGNIGSTGSQFVKQFQDAGGGLSGFLSVAKTGAGTVAKFATSLAGLAILVGVVVSALGVMSAILSGVLAAVTAVAGSIAFGLVGALAPLVGLLPVIAGLIGGLSLGFTGLDKAGKKALTNTLKPLTKEFKDLQKATSKGLFSKVKQTAADLTPVVKNLRPLFRDIGASIAGVAQSFADAANSKGFRSFVRSMDHFIPAAITKLGDIAKNIFAGLGPVFVALEPSVLRLLDAVDRIAKRFADWASSKKGREEIKDFLGRAATSALQLVGLLSAAGGLLGTLFDNGKDTGDNIITEMTDQLNTWNAALKDPKNKKAISEWFANGKQVAEDLGDIVTAVAGVVHALDDKDNRSSAHGFLQFITSALNAVKDLAVVVKVPLLSLIGTITFAIKYFHLFSSAVGTGVGFIRGFIADMVTFVLDKLGILLDGATAALGWIPGIGGKLKDAKAKFHQWVDDVNADIRGIDKGFTVTGRLKMEVDAVNSAKLSPQATAKLLDIAFSKFAKGGRPPMGWPSLIGENGPELWMPDTPGRILPHDDPATQAFLRGNGTTTSNTTNIRQGKTIDASGWTIVSPTEDPRRVADEIVNRLAGATL